MYLQIWLITSFKIFKISTQQTINCPQNMLKVNTVVVNTEDRHSSGAFSVQFEHTSCCFSVPVVDFDHIFLC